MSDGPALIVGLGNPGPEYARTRHNVGFRVIELLADRLGAKLKPVKGIRALAAEARDGDRRVVLAEPTTYMNLSGDAVAPLARYHKAGLADVVVVHDEMDLPLGAIRVKRGGGDAGHNGLRSLTRSLGSKEYVRVRIGIGRPRSTGVDHVLDSFSKKEEEEIAVAVQEAADAVQVIVGEGLEAAQRRWHQGPEKPQKRAIRKQAVVPASVADVWAAWTTPTGARTFFAPDAKILLRRGGPYELYFDADRPAGRRGSEGCQVITFKPRELLVFSWNAPPSMPTVRAGRKTRVEVRLEPDGDAATRVRLAHTGWLEGPEWDEAFAYFDDAWDTVLARLVKRFEAGPLDWTTARA